MPAAIIPFTILYDGTGEPDPYQFNSRWIQQYCLDKRLALTVRKERLKVGDYSLDGYQELAAVERKKINDFTSRLSDGKSAPTVNGKATSRGNRKRRTEFIERQVNPLTAMPFKAIILEFNLEDIVWKRYQSNIHPNSVLSTIASIIAGGLPVIPCSDGASAEQLTFLLLVKWFNALNPELTGSIKNAL